MTPPPRFPLRRALFPVLAGLVLASVPAPAQTLLHHWALDGNANDAVGGANGTELGGLTYTTGQFGQAVSLDGVDDYISTSVAGLVPATDYTLTAWVFWDGANGTRGYIAGAQNSGTDGEVFTMGRAANGTDRKLFLNLLPNGGQGNSVTESPDSTISTGVWQHVAYSVDSTNGTVIYLNGSPVGTNPARTTHGPGTTNFNIGNNPDTGAPNIFDGLIDDVAVFAGVLDSTQLNAVRTSGAAAFAGTDTTPPAISGLDPANGAAGVDATADLTATFDETIALKPGGTITIRNLDDGSGASDVVITLPDPQATASGSTLVINPAADLAPGTNFAVRISADAVEDTAATPNGFPGISDDSTWAFTTTVAPGGEMLLHHWKLDGDALDAAGGADGTEIGGVTYATGRFGLAASLDGIDDMISTAAGTIVPATDYTLMAWVFWDGANGSRGYIAGAQDGGGAGEVFTMGRNADGTDRKLFLNLLNNGGQGNSITESPDSTITTGAWQHVAYTVDSTAGTTLYVDGMAVGTNPVRTTHDPATTLFHIGNNPDTGAPDPFDGLIDEVAIFNGVLAPEQINNARDDGAENFNTDLSAPSITAYSPAPGTGGVYPGTGLVATFNEGIVLVDGGTITIRNLDDGSGASDLLFTLPDPAVSVSGNALLIDPPANLPFATNLAVRIGAAAVEDDATPPNGFPGIGDDTTWSFATAAQDPTAPLLIGRTPADDELDVPRNSALVATFDEAILPGSGDITIRDLGDGSTTQVIPVTDSSQVTVSGQVLTVTPSTLLANDTDYAVQIAAGAVKNFSDLGYAGIPSNDETSWNFRTRATSPNVIFILGDDQAWYDYSFMYRPGVEKTAIDLNPSVYQVAQTPAIDRLADEGLTFTHGYTTPICRPSLASIITGAFPHQTLVTGNDLTGRPPDDAVEARMQVLNPLPRTLANELGYTSFQTGKWWEGNFANGGFTHGDTVNSTAGGTAPPQWSGGKPGYVTARHGDWGLMTGRVDYVNDVAAPADPIPYANTVQTATDFIDTQVTAQQPFFLWYAPFLPHTPHDPPTGLINKYDALISEPNESGNFFAKYYANIERFDGGVGAILDHLDARGITDDTIVVLICDNGWINQPNSSAYDARSKQTPYEGGIRTPIIIRWPDRIRAGGALEPEIITTPVSLVDLVPTIHDALGLATYPEMTGISLIDPSQVAARDTVFSEDSVQDIQDLNDPSQSLQARTAIRDGWKLILFTNGDTELYHLYDTSTGAPVDPFETNDLSAANPALVCELTTAIVNWYAVAPNDFGGWISDPGFGVASGDQGFGSDPDGDDLANGLEAVLGTHPGKFNAGLGAPVVDGLTTTFSHPRNDNPPGDMSVFYQWSPNLLDWYAGDGIDGPPGGLTMAISANGSGRTTTVSAVASAPAGELFFRIGAQQD